MKLIWHIRGKSPGTFEEVSDDEASRLVGTGDAQLADGSALELPENHPHYKAPDKPQAEVEPKTARKKKYPNKMMTTDDK